MEAVAEIDIPAKNPAMRQVLANVGNRYVVFGSRSILPGHRILGPNDVRQPFSERVGDEYDFPPERLVQSVLVDGAEVRPNHRPDHGWDIEVIYPDQSKSLVQIKIRTRDFVRREFQPHLDWLQEMKAFGSGSPEVWNFNIERLRLNIMTADPGGIPRPALPSPDGSATACLGRTSAARTRARALPNGACHDRPGFQRRRRV